MSISRESPEEAPDTVNVRIPKTVQKDMKKIRSKADEENEKPMSYAQLIDNAWKYWKDGSSKGLAPAADVGNNTQHVKGDAYPPDHQRWHDALEEILSANNEPFISGLLANLEMTGQAPASAG